MMFYWNIDNLFMFICWGIVGNNVSIVIKWVGIILMFVVYYDFCFII